MKKRIISLILVVAMAFLTLTGCAYNYAKDDMSKYATLDYQKFYDALQALVITDGDFGTNEEDRAVKVQDAIAQAILKVTDTTEKVFAGNVEKYDALYFCYYATDAEGNVFYASKMDETKPTNIQIGLTTLEGLNKAISAAIPAEDIANYIYSTSSATVVGKGDVISLSYTKTWKEGETVKTETKSNTYFTVGENDKLAEALIGKQVGVALDEFKITEKIKVNEVETDVECTYTDVKVESIVKDNSTIKVADGDVAYLTYTITFDAKGWYNEETKKYELPEGYDAANVDSDGNYKATVSYEKNTIVADPADATAETETLLGKLVDKTVGSTTSSITVKNVQIGDKTIEVKYTNVKVNWIVNSTTEGFTVNFTPYDEELKEDNSNKKTETNVEGEKITLNKVELTYHIFPVYYLDVENVNAELIIREFYSTVASTQTKDHDHTEEDHEHETEYVFDTLNPDNNGNEFKNGDKTLADLVKELVTLYSTLTTKEKTLTDALKALNTAQSNLAKDTGTSDSETASLNTKLQNADKSYITAKKEVDEAQAKVDEMITKILACKKGETTINEGIVEDYTDYQYDTLETAYKTDIKNKLATQIIEYLNKNVTFNGELPKKAVKNAYNAIMNTYKNDFYEGKYSSSSSSSTSTSTSTETNYKHYKGDFDAYLIDKLTNKGTMSDVKAKIQEQAEKTVKDIIIIYIFADAVEEKWEDADIILTKAEKKEIKKNLENTALLYQQYGLTFNYNVEDSYNAEQFDKVMNYLLEEKETEGNKVEYNHVVYTIDVPQDK